MAAVAAPQQPVPAQLVGNAFVHQYYHILHHSPGLVYRFYQDISKLGRPEDDGSMSMTTTMQAINEKIVSLNYEDFRTEIKSVNTQESFNGGVQVLVTGYLTGKENTVRNFAQTFFLAPQDIGYFVLNDMLQYIDNASVNPALVNEVMVPVVPELVPAPPVQDNVVPEQSPPAADEAIADEAITGEVYNPSENEDVPIVEEVPVAEVVDEIQVDSQIAVECSAKIEETPKKSYASIVMHLKDSAASFSPPAASPRKVPPRSAEVVGSDVVPASNGTVPNAESVENGINLEADGYSIYLRGLPISATDSMLEEVFKKFGAIKSDGIQVRSNGPHRFCFGFVEYEDASSVQKAIEASPVTVGGRQVYVEEKRSTYSRGSNRGRFQPGRGGGFRNEGGRGGRGNYGGGGASGRGGYNNRGDFDGRSEFVNRVGNRGGSTNRDGGYHQKPENFNSNGGGRMNRNGNGNGGGMPNRSSAKSMTPVEFQPLLEEQLHCSFLSERTNLFTIFPGCRYNVR